MIRLGKRKEASLAGQHFKKRQAQNLATGHTYNGTSVIRALLLQQMKKERKETEWDLTGCSKDEKGGTGWFWAEKWQKLTFITRIALVAVRKTFWRAEGLESAQWERPVAWTRWKHKQFKLWTHVSDRTGMIWKQTRCVRNWKDQDDNALPPSF